MLRFRNGDMRDFISKHVESIITKVDCDPQ